jgi:nicotinic acid mononucleotide adenylyltransferase
MGAAAAASLASFSRSAQYGHSVFEGGTSRPQVGQIQLNIIISTVYEHGGARVAPRTARDPHSAPLRVLHACITKVVLALEFIYRATPNRDSDPGRVAVFPGAWNPPTQAHVEISRAARAQADEAIWVMPRAFPHKGFEGASFEARLRMLEMLAKEEGFSAAVSDGGLYAEIAAEAEDFFKGTPEIVLVCGRDAAERMATWDYGAPGVFNELLRRHRLLVASRNGEYRGGDRGDRIAQLAMGRDWSEVSSSEVRRRIANGGDWRGLVPPALAAMVKDLYMGKDLY